MTSMDTARRVTVVTPNARVDVALPSESTVAELLPQLMNLAGVDDARAGGGWALSRLGGAALEGGFTVSAAGVRDGEVLYLRPRAGSGAPLLFDDVVDAIASAADSPGSTWQPATARGASLVAAAVALSLGGVALFLAAPRHSVAAVACGGLALVLVLTGGALGRAYADSSAGVACGLAGIMPAYLAGAVAISDDSPFPPGAQTAAVGLVTVTIYAALAAVLVADRLPWFVALVGASATGAAGAAAVTSWEVRPVSSAAVCLAFAMVSGFYAPMFALRLSRLPLPRVPADVEAFRVDETATMGPDVLDQTSEAAGLLAGLLGAAGIVVIGSAGVLLHDGRPSAVGLAAVGGLASVLRSRSYAAAAPRILLLIAGVAAMLAVSVDLLDDGSSSTRLLVAGAAGVVGFGALVFAGRITRARTSPYFSRLLDVAELASVISILPLAGAVIGIYAAVRG
jgi:type VII secretion integral membrane protein EccD